MPTMKTALILTRLYTLAAFIVFLAACQTSNVMVDYDTDTDFSTFHYFDWHTDNQIDNAMNIDPLMLQRTKDAVEKALLTSSLTPATEGKPADILIRLDVSSNTYDQESSSRASIGFGTGGRRSAVGIGLSLPLGGDVIVKETHIVVDVIGVADKKLKWRGSQTIKTSDESPQEIGQLMNSAVAEIFRHYPPN